jgi:glycosyltransferase involved in cell wall biosynthesis
LNRPKRILLVANTTWNIYNFRQNIIKVLEEKGHEVIVLAPIDEFIFYKENFPKVKHYGIRTLSRDSVNPFIDFLLFLELFRKYKQLNPDFIIHYTHKPNIYGSIAAGLQKKKSVAVVTGLGYLFLRKGFLLTIGKMLYKLAARMSSMLIFENQDDQTLFIQEGIISERKTRHINGCGVDLKHYQLADKHNNEQSFNFLFAGRLLKDKGIYEFCEAARILKQKYKHLKFTVVGDFDDGNPSSIDRDEMAEWVNTNTIDYKGFVHDIRQKIAYAAAVVLPSYREGLPRVLIEAMAMGVPIIATDTAGCRSTIEDGKNGFLVPVKDATSLARSMEVMINLPPAQRQEMGLYGRQKAEREFDDKKVAQYFNQLIDSYL